MLLELSPTLEPPSIVSIGHHESLYSW